MDVLLGPTVVTVTIEGANEPDDLARFLADLGELVERRFPGRIYDASADWGPGALEGGSEE